ncbi:MAG: hypothetical protein ACM3QX_03730, partial [Syntrophomonadaceae bacterium]
RQSAPSVLNNCVIPDALLASFLTPLRADNKPVPTCVYTVDLKVGASQLRTLLCRAKTLNLLGQ